MVPAARADSREKSWVAARDGSATAAAGLHIAIGRERERGGPHGKVTSFPRETNQISSRILRHNAEHEYCSMTNHQV